MQIAAYVRAMVDALCLRIRVRGAMAVATMDHGPSRAVYVFGVVVAAKSPRKSATERHQATPTPRPLPDAGHPQQGATTMQDLFDTMFSDDNIAKAQAREALRHTSMGVCGHEVVCYREGEHTCSPTCFHCSHYPQTTDGCTITTFEQEGEYVGEDVGRIWIHCGHTWACYAGFTDEARRQEVLAKAQTMTALEFDHWFETAR